jgi:hypothetical protein
MEAQNKLTLKEIYLRALAENISAKEAGAKYGCNYISLLNRGPENGLPPLYSHWKRKDQRNLENMTDSELAKLKEQFESWTALVILVINEKAKAKENSNGQVN